MKEFIYQIRIKTDYYESKETLAMDIIKANDKKEVIKFIEENYPEYFDNGKVVQKLSRKTDKIVYVLIYELDDYWKNYWNQEIECTVCGKKIPLLQTFGNLGSINTNKFTCSLKCKQKQLGDAKNTSEEYWNSVCNFYFIYKISNKKDKKVYIGYTAREPLFRWWEHLQHSDLPMGQALRNEGIENFTFEVLEKHSKEEKTISEMHEIESKYIKQCNSIENGYNCILSKIDS